MKIITQEEFENLLIKGRGRSSHVYNKILNMKPGELLRIDKADWNKRYSVSRISSYIGKRQGRKYEARAVSDKEVGWVVRRIS